MSLAREYRGRTSSPNLYAGAYIGTVDFLAGKAFLFARRARGFCVYRAPDDEDIGAVPSLGYNGTHRRVACHTAAGAIVGILKRGWPKVCAFLVGG